MAALHELSLAQASRAIARREVSPVELTQALLERIQRLDGRVHAFILPTAELALAQAAQAQAEIAAGRLRGPLHGIPFGLKDIYDTAGIPTTGHSAVFRDRVPDRDAECLRRLRASGAVLVGKLATHEMAHGGPSHDLPWPAARNPWNLARFTGGSSSGSAAALAARFLPAACGSDTGGSIRGPASLCGVSGHMPTAGLVSRRGVIPNSYTLDRCGPMARTAEDCALLLQALAGHDPGDPGSFPWPARDYAAALTPDLRGVRIGVVREYWEGSAAPAVAQAMEAALATLRELGAELMTVPWLPLRNALDVKIGVGEPEIFSVHAEALRCRPHDFGEDFLQRVLPACLLGAVDYVNAGREHARLMRQARAVFGRCDVLVTLAQGAAPRLDACRPLDFWRKPNTYAPANISGGPALAVCNGFDGGLPLGMQIIGPPGGDAAVLRVGHAYQQATAWHARMPDLDDAGPEAPAAAPPPAQDDDAEDAPDAALLALCEQAARRAGLPLDERILRPIRRAAPYVMEMSRRLAAPRRLDEATACVLPPLA